MESISKNAEMRIEDGIVFVKYLPQRVDIEVAKAIVAERLAMIKGQGYPVLADTRNVNHVTKEARTYLSSAAASEGVLAGAIISDSALSAFIANFFLKVDRPNIPARMFTNAENALKWLQQHKTKHS